MTATRIIWSEEMTLIVARDLQAVQESFYEALQNGGWVLIDADDGQKVSVNPSQVLYLEEIELPRSMSDNEHAP